MTMANEVPVSLNSGSSTPYLAAGSAEGPSTPRTELSDLDYTKDVAVVGMGCRLAGGNNSPEDLWRTILSKTDTSGEIPSMRWEPYLRRDIRNAKILAQTTKRGYFLDNIEDFDAAFFGISPKEAEQMDPQQRLSLEVAWEALENAGIPPQDLSGSDTAVFMGVNSDDYSKLLLEDLPRVDAWMGIGTAYCGIPNRISYHLNLMGPSTAVDAACASSLVAIHLGRQAILQGESKIAIAGGVNALGGPGLTAVLDKAGATSPEGCCRSFDDAAKGYGRGEGAAVVILKDIASAIYDGDNILAVLKGSAVAQDGRTNGIMAPNAKAQELVARNALAAANIDPSTVSFVEAHATSTPLGDPTEVSAISAVYGKDRPIDQPCFIGSVKPNVGHLEAGAGAVGFIKAVMAVQKGILPPQANLKTLNSRIDWKRAGVRAVQEAQNWPPEDPIRRAGTCSYGYGGTVSHAVIEEYFKPSQPVPQNSPGPQVLLLSAPQEKRLAAQADTLASWLSTSKTTELSTIAATLATRRGHHDYRAAFVVNSHEDALEQLESFANASSEWTCSERSLGNGANLAWVFSGHGAQWPDMAKELLVESPVFLDAISSLEHIVEREMDFSALEALRTGSFDTSDKVQVLTYLMQVGLIAVLQSKGLRPDAVIGHSVGEIAASVAAGSITAEEGALIVTRRANLYRRVMGSGAMILVNLPFAEIERELADESGLTASIVSSPSSCVVSGAKEAIEALTKSLEERGVRSFRVKTDIAFHHPMLEQLSEPLTQALKGTLSPRRPDVFLYSTSAEDPRTPILRDIPYWTNNMVNPVRLVSAVTAAVEDGMRLFLEVSSHPVVSHSIKETLMAQGIEDFSVVNTMNRNKPASKTVLRSVAQLHCLGATVDWKAQMPGVWCPDVPGTTWSHKPIWRQIETGPVNAGITHDVDKHTLLGQRVTVASEDTVLYLTSVDESTKPFPGSHPLHGSEIVPAAALVNTFLHGTGSRSLEDITLRVPVAIGQPRDIQVLVQSGQVKICSRLIQKNSSDIEDGQWLTHTTGRWHESEVTTAIPDKIDISAVRSRIGSKLADNFSIDYLAKVGVSAMGFPWTITEHYGNPREMIARVDVFPHGKDAALPWDAHSWAPILDAATSVGSTIFFDEPRLRMPAHIQRFNVYTKAPPPKVGYLYVQETSDNTLAVHVTVCDEQGNLLAKFESMRFSEIEGTPGVSGSEGSLVHQLAWPPASYSETPLQIRNVVLVSEDTKLTTIYSESVKGKARSITLKRAEELLRLSKTSDFLGQQDTVIAYIPGRCTTPDSIPTASGAFIFELLEIVKFVVNSALSTKVFVLTDAVSAATSPVALAQAPLHGLSRIIASEHPDAWGALIDLETPTFPLDIMKYVQGVDNIRISDGIPRVARLRSLPRANLLSPSSRDSLLPNPAGTYLVTGGLGALGLEVADFLVEKGARRLILVSRRPLPPRSQWSAAIAQPSPLTAALQKIQLLESHGATVSTLAVDVGAPSAASQLSGAIDALGLPPVSGVVHAAGVLEDQLVMFATQPSFQRVLAPKVSGALALNSMFPPKTLDFMVLFSSCGQLFGFPGQASYASGNAFLDALATNRRNLGDNTIAIQWTSWRGMGMASSTEFISAELASKGITDITRDEAFRAWVHASKYDIDQVAVLRSLAFEAGEPLPSPLLEDIAIRKSPSAASGNQSSTTSASSTPSSPAERRAYFDERIRECVARVLHLGNSDEVESKTSLSDLGVDSVMTVSLRDQLQKSLGVKVPPTLTWSCPTVSLLVEWLMEKQ